MHLNMWRNLCSLDVVYQLCCSHYLLYVFLNFVLKLIAASSKLLYVLSELYIMTHFISNNPICLKVNFDCLILKHLGKLYFYWFFFIYLSIPLLLVFLKFIFWHVWVHIYIVYFHTRLINILFDFSYINIFIITSRVPRWLSHLSIWLLVLAQVMISWFVNWSPTSAFKLTVQSLLRILSPSLSAPPLLSLSLKINRWTFFFFF